MNENIIEIKSAKERFMGNWKMFSKFLYQFPDKSLFGELSEHIDENDAQKAFETAHTMKGISANLSLKLMEKPLSDVVETLRGGQIPQKDEFDKLKNAYNVTVDEIKRLQREDISLF